MGIRSGERRAGEYVRGGKLAASFRSGETRAGENGRLGRDIKAGGILFSSDSSSFPGSDMALQDFPCEHN